METGGEGIKSRVDTKGDRTGYNLKTKQNGTEKSPQRGDKGKIKINSQVVHGHSPQIRSEPT